MIHSASVQITPEVLSLIASIDEFKGAWRALGTLAPDRLSALRRVAFAFFALKNTGKQLAAFSRWIMSNRIDRLAPATTARGLGYHYHLGPTQAVDAASLVEVFESVLSARRREVFVSMEFGTHTWPSSG